MRSAHMKRIFGPTGSDCGGLKSSGTRCCHSNWAEPEAAREASLPCPATYIRGLPCVGVASSVDSVASPSNWGATNEPRDSKQSQKSKPEESPQPP